MVAEQLEGRGVGDARVLAAMREVPRHLFVLPAYRDRSYDDAALPIEAGQTISQPYMVARTTALAAPRSGDRVLEIGTGSGYQAAVLSRLAAEVVSVERIAELADHARASLAAAGIDNVEVVVGDGTLGYAPRAPYDEIVVTAGAREVPVSLLAQLAPGGRLVVPVGGRAVQRVRVIERRPNGMLVETEHDACVYVPLVGKDGGW